MRYPICTLIFLPLFSCQPSARENMPDINYMTVEVLDDRMRQWVGDSARARLLAEGFDWSEGPVWLENEKKLLFSDVPVNTVYAWSEQEGLTTYLSPSGYTASAPRGGEMGSNGLAVDQAGHLILCQHGDRRIARMIRPLDDPGPDFETLAGTYNNMRFNSPNDVVIASNGRIYFTDPPYGLEGLTDDPARETPFQGVYCIEPDGQVSLLTDSLARPNGIALSPDEKTLYVGNSSGENPWWIAYQLDKNDSVREGRILVDASEYYADARGPDGMSVTRDGTIISSGFGGVWFIQPDGTVLGRILVGTPVSNTALDDQEKNLYITADNHVWQIRLRE